MKREYRKTKDGTLYSIEEIMSSIPEIAKWDSWSSLEPIFVEDEELEKVQETLWFVYGKKGGGKPTAWHHDIENPLLCELIQEVDILKMNNDEGI